MYALARKTSYDFDREKKSRFPNHLSNIASYVITYLMMTIVFSLTDNVNANLVLEALNATSVKQIIGEIQIKSVTVNICYLAVNTL